MSIRVTQVGNEVWLRNTSNIRVTQVGNEIWLQNTSRIRVTQVGLEVWRWSGEVPLAITGNADGIARVYAYEAHSMPVTGNADGYATARDKTAPDGSAIMVVMGI